MTLTAYMVRSVCEVVRYTEIHITYNILVPMKLQYLATHWSWRCQKPAFAVLTYRQCFTGRV